MHHTLFDDGLSPARKINVQLTAGGGGAKSDNRKEKIKARNIQLDENRAKRIHKENEAKKGNAATGSTAEESGIHPSRLAMLS
ncbi:hypothetical protein VDGD_02473 [Verticillium dahliae]|nr:hypothetical protein VDGD_02473 [Verticillium dahliae]